MATAQQSGSDSGTEAKTITKKELVDRIADATGQKRVAVRSTIQAFLDEITKELGDGNRLEFRDFGVFEVKRRAARMAQNPKTLERVPVPQKFAVKFKPGRQMKQAMDDLADTGTPHIEVKPAAKTAVESAKG